MRSTTTCTGNNWQRRTSWKNFGREKYVPRQWNLESCELLSIQQKLSNVTCAGNGDTFLGVNHNTNFFTEPLVLDSKSLSQYAAK